MKKLNLNKKGFTLIELLAIIVILAIIMVVTIPTVLNSLSSAKEGQLENATNSVAEWFEKQYSLDKLGGVGGGVATAYGTFTSSVDIKEHDSAPISIAGSGAKDCSNNAIAQGSLVETATCSGGATAYQVLTSLPTTVNGLTATVLEAAGISGADANIDTSKSFVWYNKSEGMCVTLTAKDGGSFDNDNENTKQSSGC